MRKLALSDEILMKVDKPARYIGNEFNSVMKDTSQVNIRFAMCFPDVYEIGMSHLGIQILYDMFNRMDDVWCERVYSPWPDLHEIMKQENIPLFGLESQESIKDFDFVAMTLQYEMCYTNILQILDLAQIPLRSRDREDGCPIVIAGGPCTYNPEPIADFFDIFYIGEGETQYGNLFELYKKAKADGLSREEFLHEAAKIEGLYVPALYEVEYNEDGTICCMKPKYDDIPVKIKKQVQVDLTNSTYPEAPVVPFIKATQDRMVLEIQRGCIRGCRFCQAGMIYRPNREKKVDHLKDVAAALIKNTGHEEISLSSLSSSDYKELDELITFLLDICKEKKINISLPSLRIDAQDNNYSVLTTDIASNKLQSGILINTDGQVIGLSLQDFNPAEENNTLTAVSISDLSPVIEKLESGADVPYIGITCTTVTEKIANRYNIPKGVYIKQVTMDSPAFVSGLQSGDVIVAVNNTEVSNVSAYNTQLMKQKPEDTCNLKVKRKGSNGYTEITCQVKIGVMN